MLNLLLRIQDACLQLDWLHLTIPGLAAVVLGLFLWLGGARYAWVVVGLLGAALGSIAGLFASQWFGVTMGLAVAGGAAVFALLAILMRHTVIILLAGLIFAFVCGVSYMGYALNEQSGQGPVERIKQQALGLAGSANADGGRGTSPSESLSDGALGVLNLGNALGGHEGGLRKLRNIGGDLRKAASTHRNMLLLWAVVGATVGLGLAYVLKKLIMPLCCSIAGSAGVIGGMLALFLAKDVDVFSSLQSHPRLLPIIFGAMIIFGSLVQTLLAGARIRRLQADEEEE